MMKASHTRIASSPLRCHAYAICRPVPFGVWIACLLWLLVSIPVRSQEYSLLRDSTVIGRNYGLPPIVDFSADRAAGDLSLAVETVFFAKNLELTGSPNIDGETFLGTVIPLRLNYLASDQVQIELGGYFGTNHGDEDSVDISELLARVIYQPFPDQFAIAGSLIQTHWIHDALLDDVTLYRDGLESGLQYRSDLPGWKFDAWIDWRIRETEARSEQFDGAVANQFRVGGLWLDGQVLWSHTGGQKNAMGQVANNSTGMFGLSYGFGSDQVEGGVVRLGARYLASHFESRTMPTRSGQGMEYFTWINVPLEINDRLRLFGRYFEGDEYFSVRGDPLYRFDDYSQLGFDWIHSIQGNLDLEIGFVGQYADDTFMNTYQINFVWQNRFFLTNRGCEERMPVSESSSEIRWAR
jgi:hypothetical protein